MNYNLLYNFIFSDLCSWGHVSHENSSDVIDLNSNNTISHVHTGTRLQDILLEYSESIQANDYIYVLRPPYYENMPIRW